MIVSHKVIEEVNKVIQTKVFLVTVNQLAHESLVSLVTNHVAYELSILNGILS